MTKIIFATGNKDKMREIREIMADCDVEIYSMKEAGINIDIVEDGDTFEANSTIKAKAISDYISGKGMSEEQKDDSWKAVSEKYKGAIVLADDSGLEIDYLNKEPGVYSARYMGEDTSYDIKNQNLIDRLEGVEKDKRTARFVCVIAAVLPDGEVLVSRDTMEGYIGWKIAGENGFGYDPIFYLDEFGCSSAELSREQKNAISHRGKALAGIKKLLRKYF
ncbi:MAG: non-canonical purine NTP pyrophosphatase [Lachnobacterium sp.]|nr:non-canonical purine NTP pyrophosphatase [Lachnobacterium sp.]MDD6631414.1 non-canonical purine NTP pyrophosphatase [Lachnobacterium sp.]MDY2911625.1 non-canonical purine NTP pyrophosphatase [Agathobacter sp.]